MDDLKSDLMNNKNDKPQLYNFNNFTNHNHTKVTNNNHLNNNSSTRPNKISNRNSGLSVRERKSINIDSICHLNWMLIILLFTLINLYNFGYLESRCKDYKSILLALSRIISSLTAIETTSFFIIWFFLTNSRHCHMQIIYDCITALHIFMAFLNILYAISTFLSKTCEIAFAESSETRLVVDLHNFDKLQQLAYKYDLKIAGLGHILLTIIVAFSAIHLTTKRSKFFLHYLTKRGLMTEFLWETLD